MPCDVLPGSHENPGEGMILNILKDVGAYMMGHFLLTSGLHSDTYIEKFRILERPREAGRLLEVLARRFTDAHVDVVMGPTTGGIIVAYELARWLGVRAIFAELENGARMLRRGFKIAPGERVLVAEDVVTTGGSVREVIGLARDHGGDVVGVALMIDRSGGKVDFGVRTESLVSLNLKAFDPEECPLCREGIPLTAPGRSGKSKPEGVEHSGL